MLILFRLPIDSYILFSETAAVRLLLIFFGLPTDSSHIFFSETAAVRLLQGHQPARCLTSSNIGPPSQGGSRAVG